MTLVPPYIAGMMQHTLESDMPDTVAIFGPDGDNNYTVPLIPPFKGRLQFKQSDESNGTGNQFGSVDVASAWLYAPLAVVLPTGFWQATVNGQRFSLRQNSRGQTKLNGKPIQQYVELQLTGPAV